MTLQITTADDLIVEVAARVMQIRPRREAHRNARWHYTRGENLTGASLRAFDIIPGPKRVDPDGPHGDGIGYSLPIRIRVSYPDLDRTDAVLTAGDDGDDLWQMLEHAHLEVIGMLPLHYEGREPYRWHLLHDEERALVFDFAIELPFLGSDQFQTYED